MKANIKRLGALALCLSLLLLLLLALGACGTTTDTPPQEVVLGTMLSSHSMVSQESEIVQRVDRALDSLTYDKTDRALDYGRAASVLWGGVYYIVDANGVFTKGDGTNYWAESNVSCYDQLMLIFQSSQPTS